MLEIDGKSYPVGKLLLSPTRTFLPVFQEIAKLEKKNIHGIIHCTGGGQTKVLKFSNNVHIIKDNLFPTPPIFSLIQKESGATWEEMYRVFNMGNRMEFYVDQQIAPKIVEIANSFNIKAQIIGKVVESTTNELTIESEHGQFYYH
jgi:phosphoribosylformylglycinamidine cyclo-ligase